MSAVLAAALLFGWSVRRARTRAIRPGVGRRRLGPRWARRRWRGPRPSWRVGGRTADPAPLLSFRTAIERGASVVGAFESVASAGGRWSDGAGRLVRRARTGATVQGAIDAWVAEARDPAARLLADALAISAGTGGSHLRAVDAVIDAVRDRAALQREVRALASQAQTSAVVLVVLPVAFAVAVGAVDPRVRGFYLGSPLGPVCLLVGCGLDAIGGWLMLRLVRSVA